MSIAVSAVVKPSRLLLAMVGSMCVGVIFVGLMIGAGQLGNLALLPRLSVAATCIFPAVFAFFYTVQMRKTHHIDISGSGLIRLVETSALATSPVQSVASHWRGADEVVSLMANSTLWPYLLLLRLQAEDQRVTVLPILPDSIDKEGFRALSVACHWIAAQNNPKEHTNL
jgi:toxin CptA